MDGREMVTKALGLMVERGQIPADLATPLLEIVENAQPAVEFFERATNLAGGIFGSEATRVALGLMYVTAEIVHGWSEGEALGGIRVLFQLETTARELSGPNPPQLQAEGAEDEDDRKGTPYRRG